MLNGNVLNELTPGNRGHELASIVALIRSRVVPAHRIAAFIDHVGSAVSLVQLSEDDRLFAVPEASHEVIGAVTPEDVAAALSDVNDWENRGLDVRTVLDDEYPSNLHEVFDRPPLIFVEGRWIERIDSLSVAIVGTRKASHDGLARARRLSRDLCEAGFTILSGLAAGIDTAAHSAALDAGGRTHAVMGTGLDYRFPKENAALAEQIQQHGGSLMTQFFPHQPPTNWTFPMRNVVMSGLALATVVVEASETSGARMQARVALQHGRTVFLLKSLVDVHKWAAAYVEEGAYGSKAIVVTESEDIIGRLRDQDVSSTLLSA